MGINDDLRDALVRHHLMVLRATKGLALKQGKMLVSDIYRPLLELIASRLVNVPTSGFEASERISGRLKQLLEAADKLIAEGYAGLESSAIDDMVGLANVEARFAAKALEQVMPVDWTFEQPSAGYLRSLTVARPFHGRHLREWYEGLELNLQGKVRQQVRQGLAEGQGVEDIVRRLKGTKANGYKDGVLDRSRRELEGVVRTAANHTSNHAREATYSANSDIVLGVQYVATLDGRTTLQCASLDGQVFPLTEGPRPPLHINCRSTTVPYLKSWKEMGLPFKELTPANRASMNGEVAADTTFEQWFSDQGKEFQLEYLGPTRYEIWKAEGSLSVLVDAANQPIPVAALIGE